MRYRGVDSGCELVEAEPVEAVWLVELDGDTKRKKGEVRPKVF